MKIRIVPKPEVFAWHSVPADLDFETEIDVCGKELPVRIEVDRRLFYVDRYEIYGVTVTIADIAMPWNELTPAMQSQVEKEIQNQDEMNAEDAWMCEQENLRR